MTHRPPTVCDGQGRDLRTLRWIDDKAMAARGIYLYHYSLLLPKQVQEKCDYYQHAEWAQRSGALTWAQEAFGALRRPFHVHNVYRYPSWLERYGGEHPQQIHELRRDLASGKLSIELRETEDIERLLTSIWYPVARFFVKAAGRVDLGLHCLLRQLRRLPGATSALGALRRLVGRQVS